MKGMGIFPTLTLAFALTAPLGFAQSSGSTPPATQQGSSATATGAALSNANVTMVNASNGPQVQALPGVSGTPGVFTGLPENNGQWVPYFNWVFEETATDVMEAGRGTHDIANRFQTPRS